MKHTRLPRFKRSKDAAGLELTDRDRKIIHLVYGHRFLRSSHIVALLDASSQPILRRLHLLYHHGYLERPRAQIDYFHAGGSRHIVYGVGNKGAKVLRNELGAAFRPERFGEKNRSVGRIFLEHALLVSDFMVALELGCRKSGRVQLVSEAEIPLPPALRENAHPFSWKANIGSGVKLGIVPDRVFALEFEGENGDLERIHFFLEADRGTMPVTRRNLKQTSVYRKFLAYEATWSEGLHRSRFGFNRFRVVTITKSRERVKSLLAACGKLKRGHGLFLFADQSILQNPQSLLSRVWKSGRNGDPASLLD